ncbi:MAG: hypothetical protein EON98_09230 [Chitinophagaceae bacterium]|nr:MAG: hypothetical protein EON98_09230 [Chitinophagaceae bacterium]
MSVATNDKGREAVVVIRDLYKAFGDNEVLRGVDLNLYHGENLVVLGKWIGVARTLILQPEIMLYDEPTAGLDPITSSDINDLINEVNEKYHTSSIIITHDLTCAKATGDRIAMLLDGNFAKKGTFDEVFSSQDERIKSFYDYNFIQ